MEVILISPKNFTRPLDVVLLPPLSPREVIPTTNGFNHDNGTETANFQVKTPNCAHTQRMLIS